MSKKSERNSERIIAKRYETILTDIKALSVKVYHRKLEDNLLGHYNPDSKCISIQNNLRGTLEGCFVLCHEYQHFLQHTENRFPIFFELIYKIKYQSDILEVIIDAEQDASKRAVEMLKIYNITYKPDDLTKAGLKDYIEIWKEYYFY